MSVLVVAFLVFALGWLEFSGRPEKSFFLYLKSQDDTLLIERTKSLILQLKLSASILPAILTGIVLLVVDFPEDRMEMSRLILVMVSAAILFKILLGFVFTPILLNLFESKIAKLQLSDTAKKKFLMDTFQLYKHQILDRTRVIPR